MHRFADITELVPDRSVVQVPDTEAAIRALYEQIAQEGIDTAMLVYSQNGTYAVVDDDLRLEALRRLRREGQLPASVSKLGVPIVLLAARGTALFRAADRMVRAQVSAAAEALYLQRLFAALETTPPNAVGGSSDREDRAAPAAHQPGRTGLLRKRCAFRRIRPGVSAETAHPVR
jgi:hypothetical protein